MGKDNVVARLGIGLTLKDKGFQNQMRNAMKQVDGLGSSFKKLGGIIAGALSVKAIVDFSKSCLELGSNLSEVQNVVDTVFPNMIDQANSWSKSALHAFGMSETVAKNYMSTLGAMSQAFGYTESEAFSQATALTKLAGDMASFYNKSTDETFNALKAIYSGETEVLKQYGIVMTETALNEYALSRGIQTTVNKMSEQEKVALRLNFVTDRMSMAAGDFQKTESSWANQTRILSLQWDAFKATIGQGLINVLTPVVQWLNTIMEAAQGAAQAFANFTSVLAPFTGSSGSGTAAIASDIASASDSAGSLASNLGGAGGAAKKLKGQLMGFDKLNVLSKASSGGGGGGGSASVKPTVNPSDLTDSVKNAVSNAASGIKNALQPFADVFNTAFSNVDWENLKEKFNGLVEAAKPLGEKMGGGLYWLWSEVLVPLGAWTVGEALPRFLETLTIGLDGLNAVLDALKPLWDDFWNYVLKPIAEWTAEKFLEAWDAINEALREFADWLKKNPQKVREFVAIMAALGIVIGTIAIAEFIANCGGLAGAFITLGYQVLASTGLITVWKGVVALATGAAQGFKMAMTFLTSPIGLVCLAIAALIAVIAALILNWDKVKEVSKKVWESIKTTVTSAWESIKTSLSGIPTWFSEKFTEAFEAVKSAFSTVGEWASGLWDTIVENFTDIGVSIGQAIGEAFKDIANGVLQTIENTINGGISFINSAISGINSLLGTSLGTIGTLTLPRLAQGGFVEANTPQLAVIGDNRHEGEIVAPESKISEAVARGMAGLAPAIANAVANAVRNVRPQSAPQPIVLTLDGQVIYDTMQEYQGRANSRSGGRA